MKNYYITTAIAYTSGKPHIGNIYEIIPEAYELSEKLKSYNYDILDIGEKSYELASFEGDEPPGNSTF